MSWEELLDSVDGIVWEIDPGTDRFRYVSRSAERLLGYPVSRWLEEKEFWESRLHPEDVGWVSEVCFEQAIAQSSFSLEYRMVAADGRVVWLRDLVSGNVEDGRLTSLRGVMVDITEQKRAEEELRVTSDRLAALLRDAPIVLFALDRGGRFTFCDGRALREAGFKPAEMIGQPGVEVFQNLLGSEIVHANIRRALAGEEFTAFERMSIGAYETRYRSLRDADGKPDGVIGVVVDVTDRVRAEEDRLALESRMQHSQKFESLGLLAGGLAHHFNNLLMTVAGNAELAIAKLPADSFVGSRLERIQVAARAGSDLTHRLLAYAGTGDCDFRPLDVSELVSGAAELMRVSISKRARLELELEPELPAVDGDGTQLTQVILSLATNAFESLGGEAGEVRLRTGLVNLAEESLDNFSIVDGPREGRFAFLEVRDTGAGMDGETRLRIFDPFFSTKFVGRGLGLATVLGIVRRHGGFVGVESEPGAGTRILILLPLAQEIAPARLVKASQRPAEDRPALILVVDDDPDVRDITQAMLERLGYQVQLASRGGEALSWVDAHRGSVAGALIDFTMPEMSGDEVARELHRIRPEVPIVLMSGFLESQARSSLHEDLDCGFLMKPFDLDQLSCAVSAMVGRE